MAVFHRTALAEDLARKLMEPPATSAAPSGLFLAAPRRTGKSTFLREDLRPALERQGALVIYADLWADRATDPGEVIVNAVRTALQQRQGVVARLAHASGVEKVSIGGLALGRRSSAKRRTKMASATYSRKTRPRTRTCPPCRPGSTSRPSPTSAASAPARRA
ncbi:MAG TPA: hypothetical protein VFM98_11795, partial [Ramlibacter sp.]|nr:hypothetical protein [Ramlibacter sp.]